MKFVLMAALVFAAPALSLAQTAQPAKSAAAKTSTAAAKPAPKPSPAAVRRSALKAVEEITPIDDDQSIKISAEDLELAKKVYVGTIACELGASVTITADEKRPGFFTVQTKGNRFRMHPVESRTGALRLEDPRGGAMWLQLGNKSMLMSQKLGQRLADECASPSQLTFAEEMKKNPLPGILDAAPKPATAQAGATSAQSSQPASPTTR
ncbi:MAG: hypothetical protein V4772_12625 [Pseudomonadota bacterium]